MNKCPVGFLLVGMVLWLSVCPGCGTGEYEVRLKEAVQNLSAESPFEQMYKASALPGTPVMVRVPKFFKAPPLVEGSQLDGQAVDPRRVIPPYVELADLKLTYEEFVVDAEGGKMPYYCYFAATDMSKPRARDQAMLIPQRLVRALPESTARWQEHASQSATGEAAPWQRLRNIGKQEFYYVDADGNGDFFEMEGLMEFYSLKKSHWLIIIGWRMPAAIEANVALQDWAPRVAGSVVFPPDDGSDDPADDEE